MYLWKKKQRPIIELSTGGRHKKCLVIYYHKPKDVRLSCSSFCIYDSFKQRCVIKTTLIKMYSIMQLITHINFWVILKKLYVSVWNGILLAPIRSFRVCISHQSERPFSSLVWETRDSERAACKMELSFRMRNVGFSVFVTCISPHFMRNAILLDRWKTTDYL